MSDATETSQATEAPASKIDAWKAAKRHTVTLPSGTKVDIVLPNLPKMLQAGDVPNTLIQTALDVQAGREEITAEVIKDQFEFYRFLVSATVVDPEIKPSDVTELPFEDIEMLVDLATRTRDLDAVGHHLSGLEKQGDFRRFRGIDGGGAFGSSL